MHQTDLMSKTPVICAADNKHTVVKSRSAAQTHACFLFIMETRMFFHSNVVKTHLSCADWKARHYRPDHLFDLAEGLLLKLLWLQ